MPRPVRPGIYNEPLPYEMPITKIIEDNSLKNIDRYKIPVFEVKPQRFRQERYMRPHIDNDRKITINREKLLTKLKENLKDHKAIYMEAQVGYFERLRKALLDLSAGAHAKLKEFEVLDTPADEQAALDFHVTDLIEPFSGLEQPVSYAEAYEEAIELFTWDETPSIELRFGEFRKLVLDKWDWQEVFLAQSAHLGSGSAIRKRSALNYAD